MTEFTVEVIVEPPEALRSETAGDHYVLITGVTTSEHNQEAYEAWGLGSIQEGNVALDAALEGPLAAAWDTTAERQGASARLTTTT